MNRNPEKPILIVDDQDSWLVSLEVLLARRSKITNVVCCNNSLRVMSLLTNRSSAWFCSITACLDVQERNF